MKDLLKLVGVIVGLIAVALAVRGLFAWLQDRRDLAWENRRRIGFQPNPEPAA